MARLAVVVVDTNVFGADLLRRGAPLAKLYRPLLEGRAFVLSFQTWLSSGSALSSKAEGADVLPASTNGWLGRRLRGPVPTSSPRTWHCV